MADGPLAYFVDEAGNAVMLGAANAAAELDIEEQSANVARLMDVVDGICDTDADGERRCRALEQLSMALRPHELQDVIRRQFIQRAIERGVVSQAVQLIEHGGPELACAASNFLGDFAFNSDVGARAVMEVFERIAMHYRHIFEALGRAPEAMLEAAISLCVNIAATCPCGHARLTPLVRPVCLQIIRNRAVSDKLRGNTILLLANLSTTVSQELSALGVADALLELILHRRTSEPGRSVAESVIIFLHGNQACREIDILMELDVIGSYCVPIMERALCGAEFRGMYPHLLYSARLFQVLTQSRQYAEALAAHPRVVPLLLQANRVGGRPLRVESDLEGRRFALEAIWSLARFRLWPRPTEGGQEDQGDGFFVHTELPLLASHACTGIRAAAVGIWACVDQSHVLRRILVGKRLEVEGSLPVGVWSANVMPFLFPFLESERQDW